MLFTCCNAMEVNSIAIEVIQDNIDFLHYYHRDTKELNLSNLQITDDGLTKIEDQLKTFIESVGVERLVIENAGLTTIPFNLVGFTIISKSLQYVSFLGNNFNLFGTITRSNEIENFGAGTESTSVSRPRVDTLVATMITQTWGSLAPHIDEVLQTHNATSQEFAYSNKQILIDRSIPPITILGPIKKPVSTCEQVKRISIRVGLFGLGVLITFVPSIIPWILNKETGSN